MLSVNLVMVMGRLCASPEVRRVGEADVTNLVLAVGRYVGKREFTEFVRVSVWGKLGENCARYLVKGQRVHVEGRLEYYVVDRGDFVQHYSKVTAERVVFLDRPRGNDA